MTTKKSYDHPITAEEEVVQELKRVMGRTLEKAGRPVYIIASSGEDKSIMVNAQGTPFDIGDMVIPMILQLPKPLIVRILEIVATEALTHGENESIH
jgi:hypothetical protein